jgi:GWxTD domain-containing protein
MRPIANLLGESNMKKVSLLALCCLAIFCLSVRGQEADQIEKLFQQGLQQFERKQWTEAQKTFESILSLNSNHAKSYFQLAIIYVELNQTQLAETHFQRAIQVDKKFAEAYHQLALVHMAGHDFEKRLQARKELLQAIQLDYENSRYWLDLAELYRRMELNSYAIKICKRILKKYPDNRDAHYILGRIAERNYLHFRYLPEFANEDKIDAMEMYDHVLAQDSSFTLAYHRLALLYYESGRFQSMRKVLQQAIEKNPKDKDAYLFLGLCHHKMGFYDMAFQAYEQAKSLMPPDELLFFNSIEPLTNPQISEEVLALSDEQKNPYQENFWKSRDPYYLTEYNERLLEHYGRVAYANLRFSLPEHGVEGWKSDRGRVYIRFGPTLNRIFTGPNIDLKTDEEGLQYFGLNEMPINRSTVLDNFKAAKEIWVYNNFSFIFEDRFLSGDFKFNWPDIALGNFVRDDLDVFNRMIKESPESYEHDYGGKKFNLPYYLADFRGESGQTKVATCCAFQVKDIDFLQFERHFEANLNRGIFFFTPEWDEQLAIRDTITFTIEELDSSSLSKNYYILTWLTVPPGDYHYGLELRDLKSQNVGVEHADIQIEKYGYENLQMSDVLVGWGTNDPGKGKWMTPNSSKIFLSGKSFTIYYEIYNLKIDETGNTRFQIDETFERSEIKTKGVFKLLNGLGELIGISQKGESVSTSYIYLSDQPAEKISKSLQLNTDVTGDFHLQIKITDLIAQQKANKLIELKIVK